MFSIPIYTKARTIKSSCRDRSVLTSVPAGVSGNGLFSETSTTFAEDLAAVRFSGVQDKMRTTSNSAVFTKRGESRNGEKCTEGHRLKHASSLTFLQPSHLVYPLQFPDQSDQHVVEQDQVSQAGWWLLSPEHAHLGYCSGLTRKLEKNLTDLYHIATKKHQPEAWGG